jgi:hypothetical protein
MISSRAIVSSRSTGGRAASSSLAASTASVAAHDETAGDSAGLRVRHLGVELPIGKSRWIALRVHGPGSAIILDRPIWAHTSPVPVRVAGRRITSRPDAEFFVAWIEQMLQVIDALSLRPRRGSATGRFAVAERAGGVPRVGGRQVSRLPTGRA